MPPFNPKNNSGSEELVTMVVFSIGLHELVGNDIVDCKGRIDLSSKSSLEKQTWQMLDDLSYFP